MRYTIMRTATYGAITTVTVLSLVVIILSPIGLNAIAGNDRPDAFRSTDWPLASTAGQAYGGISAILAGVALLAVAVSLVYQARQTRVAQLQAARSLQLELFALAYDHPELQEGWSRSTDVPFDEWKLRTYTNLVFNYLRMSFEMGTLSTASLRRTLRNRFRTSLGRDYWASSRLAWNTGASTRRQRRFYTIAEELHHASLEEPALPPPPTPPPPRPPTPPPPASSPPAPGLDDRSRAIIAAAAVTTGVAAGVVVGELGRQWIRSRWPARQR